MASTTDTHANASSTEALSSAWQSLQDTPSYISRFAERQSSFEAEASQHAQVFCGACGFWVDSTHQCPPTVGA